MSVQSIRGSLQMVHSTQRSYLMGSVCLVDIGQRSNFFRAMYSPISSFFTKPERIFTFVSQIFLAAEAKKWLGKSFCATTLQ